MQCNPYSIEKESVFNDNWHILYNKTLAATVMPYHKKWCVVLEKDKPAFWIKDTRNEALEYAIRMHGTTVKKLRTVDVKLSTLFKQQISYVFFDTETTGLPVNWKASMTDLKNWPRVIELAWCSFNDDGELLRSRRDLIKPDGWTVPKEEFWIKHGFSTEKNTEQGVPMQQTAQDFINEISEAKYIVAHNMDYDYNVLGAEMIRYNLKAKHKPERICTKEASTGYCAIPGGRGGYKWPSLTELHTKLFGTGFDGAHGAGSDTIALAKCFFELKKRGVITK